MASNGWHVACACGVRSWSEVTEAEAIAAWNTRTAAQTPPTVEGWQMVPVELSQDMLEAVVKLDFTATHDPLWPEYWSAMLSASPTPPAAGAEDGYARGIEDAAKVAETVSAIGSTNEMWGYGSQYTRTRIAAAIRLLSQEPSA